MSFTRFLLALSTLFLIALFAWGLSPQGNTQDAASPFITSGMRDMPILYQGRYRPMEAYSRQWLEERYGNPSIYRKDLNHFTSSDGSALDVLWRWMLHQEDLAKAPLFKISPPVRAILERIQHPARTANHLSYEQISNILKQNDPSNSVNLLEKQAWNDLLRLWAEPKEWKIIPPRTGSGQWLKIEQAPEEIRTLFRSAQEANNQHDTERLATAMTNLAKLLKGRYDSLTGKPSLSAASLQLYYPTWGQLSIESVYARLPGILILLLFYACGLLSLCCFYFWGNKPFQVIGVLFLAVGWVLHTLLLLARCYILARPPVSNMFETMLYVPWICMLVGLISPCLSKKSKGSNGSKILLASACSALILLSLIPLTGMRGGMENVQAVLDSRYWLIIHVMMIVGSYGAFLVSGLLAHGFLVGSLVKKISPENAKGLERAILLTLYVGVALLIPGTLLGGAWAAQSWGRFWDWDPKESWACITSCIYLFVIHLYRFGRIQALGLSFGSIIGLMAVSFTWYGVNYLLGVGLHSYGFGQGGETAYLAYLVIQSVFLSFCAWKLSRVGFGVFGGEKEEEEEEEERKRRFM